MNSDWILSLIVALGLGLGLGMEISKALMRRCSPGCFVYYVERYLNDRFLKAHIKYVTYFILIAVEYIAYRRNGLSEEVVEAARELGYVAGVHHRDSKPPQEKEDKTESTPDAKGEWKTIPLYRGRDGKRLFDKFVSSPDGSKEGTVDGAKIIVWLQEDYEVMMMGAKSWDTIPLYHHKTEGGAEYLFDKYMINADGSKEGIITGSTIVVRVDDPEISMRCDHDR